ncbi:MAG: esterase [Nocardioidaceae bacterium]|nr:esterase [Nocardioidaceae bacterium]
MLVSRRSVLLGAAGLLAGCGAAPSAPGPRAAVSHASGSFASEALRTTVRWRVAAPAGHDLEGLPVVLALHGRGGSARTAFSSLHLDELLAGAGGIVALASVDGGDHSYYHRRADGTDAGAMIAGELLPVLAGRGLDTGRLGLYGWSMGGYGALLLTGQQRLRPRAVAVSSPALFTSAGSTPAGAYDDAADFARNDVYDRPERLAGVPVRLDCGTGDPFYAATRDFAARLPGATSSFRRGGHDATYWRRAAPAALAFLAGRLAN